MRRRLLVLAFALLAPSACTLLVPTDGLVGGDADAGSAPPGNNPPPAVDSGGGGIIVLGDAAVVSDAGVGVTGELDSTTAPDSTTGSTVDAHSPPDTSIPDVTPDAVTVVVAPPDTGTVIHVDANPPGDGAPVCSNDLSNIGTGNFVISIELRTTESGLAALVNQRASCSSSAYWDLRLSSGELRFESDDGTNYTNLTSTGPEIDDGAPHTILVQRVDETVTIYVDGNASGAAASRASFGALPSLAQESDPCEGSDGTAAYQGTLAVVCIGAP
jgi:laminin G domain protein